MNDSHSQEPVTVYTCQGETDAQLIRSLLESYDIPCLLWGEAVRHVHGLTMDGLGKVEIRVAPGDEARAREVLDQADSGELSISEE